MSDPTLARRLAGSSFLRADTLRQERGDDQAKGIEQWLRNLQGWLPPMLMRRKHINAFATHIAQAAAKVRDSDDNTVRERFTQSLQQLKSEPDDQQALASTFACVGEGARRTLGMWPHPVQFAGANVLLGGRLAEMQTGEGKTLVAALAATVMAGSGAHVHVVSTNDYLAERDCDEMSPLFSFFGLTSGHVIGGMEAEDRKKSYRQAICYAAGKELVFDYLKDRLAGHGLLSSRVSHVRQLFANSASSDTEPLIPALHFAIVDEADSVLIDEARTPMILSREAPGVHEPEVLSWAIEQAYALREGSDFSLDAQRHQVTLMSRAMEHINAPPDHVRPAWRSRQWQEMLIRQALTALHFYQIDQHYIINEGKVQIVDESTGRVMADRSWEQGLHQLIEIKEGLDTTAGRETLTRMTFQRFFKRYYLLSGLTGTAAEAYRELWSVYRLKVCPIPPHRTNLRVRLRDVCSSSEASKWRRVADDACAAASRGQPVLIGTRSVEASESVSRELTARGVEHVVLNARQDADEAEVVRAAGEPGRITVATNMAGRGTDIKLGDAARRAGGLHVILTEFHDSARVDRQLLGRCGRQGDPGTTRAIVSLHDTLLKHEHLSWRWAVKSMRGNKWQSHLLQWGATRAQRVAGRRAYRARMATLKQDQELNQLIGFAGKTL